MSKLYVIPTPIGNLKDITYRAIEILKSVDLILAEDTRTSAKLLNHYNINVKTESFHMHNEHKKTNAVIKSILNGNEIAIVSDAGTPGISDPGFLLVRACIQNQIPYLDSFLAKGSYLQHFQYKMYMSPIHFPNAQTPMLSDLPDKTNAPC